MGRVIRPLERLTEEEKKQPLIFLAGPIKGGGNWQAQVIDFIQGVEPKVNIASPRNLAGYKEQFGKTELVAQADWESEYLELAAQTGCILFYLPPELASEHQRDRAYAQTTRMELGIWLARHEVALKVYGEGNAVNLLTPSLVVGLVDAGERWQERYVSRRISGEQYFRFQLARLAPVVPICTSLEGTCSRAIERALENYYMKGYTKK